jgi:hypothetical protein
VASVIGEEPLEAQAPTPARAPPPVSPQARRNHLLHRGGGEAPPSTWLRTCVILVDPRIEKQKGGTRMCHAWQCAVCTARNDAAHPRPVIVSTGAVAGGISLSEAARPMACGFVRSPRIPVLLPAFSCSAGFSSALLNRAAEVHARSHRSSHRFEQGTNCSPAERWIHLTPGRKSVG